MSALSFQGSPKRLHQRLPLLEQVAARIGGLHLVPNRVGQRRFPSRHGASASVRRLGAHASPTVPRRSGCPFSPVGWMSPSPQNGGRHRQSSMSRSGDTAKLACVVHYESRAERSGMHSKQQNVLANGTTDPLKFGTDRSILSVYWLIQRNRFDCRQNGVELLSQTQGAATRSAIVQFGGDNDTDTEGFLLQRGHPTSNAAIRPTNQVRHDVRVQQVTQVCHARADLQA